MSHDLPVPGPDETTRSGMVAVVGRANVGKSTLVNTLLEEKVSIVSPVPQTTRNLIRGVFTDERGQLCFLDTPGMHRARSDLGKVMNRIARASIEGVDAILFVMDGSEPPRVEDDGWMRRLCREPVPVFCVLNKADKPDTHEQAYRELWTSLCEEKGSDPDATWLRLSARERSGTDALLTRLFERMPLGPHLFPEDLLTDFPRRLAIADVIREKLFQDLHDEVPHDIAVRVEEIDEEDDGWDIRAVIYVNRPTQKGIVIGHKGRLLRKVRRSAEKELTDMFEHPVRVHLWVKVEKNWSRNFWLLKQLGHT